jgi:polysaccharide biosynthesis protein PslG
MRQMRAWAAAFAVVVLGAAASAPNAAALPGNFWGISPQATPSAEQFQRLRTGGVDSVRIPIGWSGVQTAKGGVPDWSHVDSLVRGAVQAGIDVLPFVYDAPSWAVGQAVVPGSGGKAKAPKTLPVKTSAQRAAWTSFLELAVGRYGPGGSFWAANPALPQRPIRTWQIWNEQNFKYFVVRPNPAEYGKLVKISHAAIKSVDPGAQIVLGGMFARPKEARFKAKPPQAYFATDFLDRMYETTPGIKSKFGGVALHPYTSWYQELTPDIEAFRAVLKQNHDAAKGLWITEIGWSSRPPAANNSFAKGPQGQVTQLKGAFNLLERNQVRWRLKRIYWFSVDDQSGACNFCDGSGLFGSGFVPKRSWFAYVKFAGGSPS